MKKVLAEIKALEKKLASFDEYDVKKWLKQNPMEADNLEDLCNWACEEFKIHNSADQNKVYSLARDLQPYLEN